MLVVNLFSGPGTGKSTQAALLFGKLKMAGVNAELVPEFAKDLTWEGREKTLAFQPYVLGKQLWRLERLRDQVDVVVTDSPILLSLIYRSADLPSSFDQFVLDMHHQFDNLNIRLFRDSKVHPYNSRGRSQSEAAARRIDDRIDTLFLTNGLSYSSALMQPGDETAERIFQRVQARLILNQAEILSV